MILLDIKTYVLIATMASGREEEKFCSEFYTEERIAAFEKLSGEGYIGSQGQAVTKVGLFALDLDGRSFKIPCQEIAPLLGLKEGDKVLDVGSGIGGFAFYLAKVKTVHVLYSVS